MSDAYSFGQELSDGAYRYLGYVLRMGGTILYHAGDTIPYDGLVQTVHRLCATVALLPINGRDATRESKHIIGNLSAQEAAEVLAGLGA